MSRYLFSFLISVSFSHYVLAGPGLPANGSSAVYSCKGSLAKELALSFFRTTEDEAMFLEWASENPQYYTDIGIYSEWGYIAGIPSLSRAAELPRLSSIKSGNLAQVASLKAGEYSGILAFSDPPLSPLSFDAQTTVKIMAKEKTISALGVGFEIPIETTIKNFDGKGGELKLKVSYSETHRIHLKKQTFGPKNSFRGQEDCILKGFKNDRDTTTSNSHTFQAPDAGTKLRYLCEKEATPAMELEIMDQTNGNVTSKITTVLGETVSTGSLWMFYFGLADKKTGGYLLADERTFRFKFDRSPDFSKGISPGFFHGVVDVSEVSKGKQTKDTFDATLMVTPWRKQIIPKFGSQTLVDTYIVLLSKEKWMRIGKNTYSPSLKSPVLINSTLINLVKKKMVQRSECSLSSILGANKKSNAAVKK
ncbi:MAG: hypothetical protein IPJ71_18050 [Bdellovibrionales bacterium]|nr:hypothetical protein [Bdellovibrionales bacterium]